MSTTDTLGILAFLASPALIALVSKQAEGWAWFQAIAPNGKLAAIAAFSALVAMLSFALTQFVTGRPELLGAIDPYVRVALISVNFVVSQATHGSQEARKLGNS